MDALSPPGEGASARPNESLGATIFIAGRRMKACFRSDTGMDTRGPPTPTPTPTDLPETVGTEITDPHI